MGRSKFPGKPSKSVMKERIRVLYKDENGKKDTSCNTKKKIPYDGCSRYGCSLQTSFIDGKEKQNFEGKLCISTQLDSINIPTNSETDHTDKSVNSKTREGEQNWEVYSSDNLKQNEGTNVSYADQCVLVRDTSNSNACSTGNIKYSLTDYDGLMKKKTVTFKNVLETSDDTSPINKIHNPLNKGPLVSIMKKECSSSQGYITRGDGGIVRPSRLTEILKNNENIDKTKLLSFRSVPASTNLSCNIDGKQLEVTEVVQYSASIRESSPNTVPLNKERRNRETDFDNQNEAVDTSVSQLNEDKYNQLLDKWRMYKLCPTTNQFARDDDVGELRKKSPKRKDSTLHNKIVLRQPRLHFEPQSEILSKEKLIKLNNSNTTNLVTTNLCTHSICGVCNTPVNKHIQNRKYGIIACDACRKFISKITKKTVSSSTNPMAAFKIQCSKRDGECLISSLPKNSIKNFKKIYDDRCSACWLKKCIKAFHFPSGHKLRLSSILSETHKNKIDLKSPNKPYEILPSPTVKTFNHEKGLLSDNDCADSQTNAMSWRVVSTTGGLMESIKSNGDFTSVNKTGFDVISKIKHSSCRTLLTNQEFCSSAKHTRFYSNSILNKKSQSISKNVESTSPVVSWEYPKRQKIGFKGPRVKHVCRSASIALGKQIATFSNDDEDISKLSQSESEIENNAFTNSLLRNIYFSVNDQENYSQKTTDDDKKLPKQFKVGEEFLKQGLVLNTSERKRPSSQTLSINTDENLIESIKEKKSVLYDNGSAQEKNYCKFQSSAHKCNGNKNLFMLTHRNISSLSKRNLMRITKARNFEKKTKIISIDFWDTYVPAEVHQTGFGLILTEPAPICAICFLCGSMDLDNLLFCASCCEPYHSYCIPEENNSSYAIFRDKNITNNKENRNELLDQLNWICPRCTVCYTCNMSSGAKIKCQKCKNNFHSTCMGTSKGLRGADRPLICRNCLKCQTCSTTKVSKYVGNQPICMQCFKVRKSGVRCPLCNHIFDTILDLIILECGICEKLIHAKCEGLTEEQSNLLSNLPGHIKFVCKKCSFASDDAKNLAKEWRAAVYEELKAGLLDVLKLLSRNRQASVLKRNNKKNCFCGFEQVNKNYHILSKDSCKSENYQTMEGSTETNDSILNSIAVSALYSKCICSIDHLQQAKLNNSLTLFDIKKKIINGEYVSLFDFNADMNDVIVPLMNDDLILTYKEILSEKFSWFQNETKTCTDALEEDMYESCNYCFQLDEMITEEQTTNTKLPNSAGKVLNSLKQDVDNRICILCLKEGDGGVLQESRLIYYGYNAWIHANCAIWSNDVYEEFDGTLQNVHMALNRGRLMKCTLCKWSGATVKCIVKTCCNYYHFQCARKAKCIFKSDKSVYCSDHCMEEKENNSSTKEMFTVFRPLYIEFDKSRRKYVEPSKVQFMMGSLSVMQLGNVYSKFSDTSEAIVPINFVCTRLYWSCREPWKIVKYSVRTLIQHATFTNDKEKHFTVDHSNNANIVETGISQIASWHNTLSRDENLDTSPLHYEYGQFGNLRFSTDSENQNENTSDTCIEEEPQNNADLLPPEIKDAIFEDLPHDILDGISMLDIFPKLMIYEDLIAVEGKSDNVLINDFTEVSEDCQSFNSLSKQESNKKYVSNIINYVDDTNYKAAHSIYPKRELHRSNSEIFLRNFDGYRNQQRSSSVTWSCKFDNTRRYFTKGRSDVSETKRINYRKLGEDYDDFRTKSIKKGILEEHKHLTQMKKEQVKIMQLDGSDDTLMTFLSSHVQNSTAKSPVKCDRCHCTYRTFDSFQRHLPNCEQISTSESETETTQQSNPDASRTTIVFQEDCIKNNLQLYQNSLRSDHNLSANISIVGEPNVINSEHIIPQNIFVTNSLDCEDGFYVNINKTIDVDNKNDNSIRNGYDESGWHNGSVGVNSFNKSISKNKKLKSNSTRKNEQYNTCAKSELETSAIPESVNIMNSKTEYTPQSKHNYLQFLNQHLALNNQYSQKEQQSQQQFVVIQQSVGNNQPLFIQQVSSPATIPQNIFPVVLSNSSMQYASIPTSTNPLVQGSILQADTSGNVILSSGLQMLSMPPLQLTSQSSPQLVGTFNQPQSLHLGSNPMLIGGAATMELMPNANQVLLTAPPVYYGLETIVQNTVMSSQQFVSTAMQGVLSQNASFSATTTQVFQSSKFEPVNDTPNGYVVLNNADGTALVVPQTNLLSGFLNTNNIHDYHNSYAQDFNNICGTHPATFIQQPTPTSVLPLVPALSDMACISVETPANRIQTTMNLEAEGHILSPGKRTAKLMCTTDNNVLPKNSYSTESPNTVKSSTMCNMKNFNVKETPMAANDYANVQITYKESDIYETHCKSAEVNNVQLKYKVQVKPKVTNKYNKRNKTTKSIELGSNPLFKNNLKEDLKLNQYKKSILNNRSEKTNINSKPIGEDNVQYFPALNSNYEKINSNEPSYCSEINHKIFEEISENCLGSKELTPNIVPRLMNRPVSQFYMGNTTKLPSNTSSFGCNSNNVPTNVVIPIMQTHQSNITPSRPTNRVLPMQSIKSLDKSKSKTITLKRPSFRDNLNKFLDITSLDVEIKKKALPSVRNMEKNNNKILVANKKEQDIDAVLKSRSEAYEVKCDANHYSNTSSLKKSDVDISPNSSEEDNQHCLNHEDTPLQSPLSDERYVDGEMKSGNNRIKVYTDITSQRPYNGACEQNACLDLVTSTDMSELDVKSKLPKQILSEQFSLSSDQTIARLPSKKELENDDFGKPSEPHLLYEIQSEDGFSYRSNSIADVWEKVFEAVQSARRLHGLSSLPMGPFADMCGLQIIGLKTNALKYLIEQLPGTESCTKYTPKYHKNASANAGSDYVHQDQEELLENIYGAIRCEPFTKRSDYDLFSWLASRHRKQPKQIFVQPSETELIARRCTGNLPMAMKYRTLKETCKYNVGVFRSLIHGRGLFCTKDIEAGEMVIEYAGELIRSTLTDKRERFYDSRGIGCYMFKIDDNFVVDATMRGNAARFINHSCEPNCYSKVVDILGHKHIIIFSLRRIVQGEELTYDYKFPFEDVKIPCSCGSKKCRKYLN